MKYFKQNKYLTGFLAELLSVIMGAVLLLALLLILSISPVDRVRWFGIAFVPGIFVLRAYARGKNYPKSTKASATTLFFTFISFIVILAYKGQLF